MPISSESILFLIKKAKLLIEECRIPYWLGRGVLRNFHINGQIGEQNSDVDFHVWYKDSSTLRQKLIPLFKKEGYCVGNPNYKLAFYRPQKNHEYYIEFMYLFQDNNPGIVYHERAGNNKRFCPATCFADNIFKTIDFNGDAVRIPNYIEQYLRGTYGENWKDNNKDDKEAYSSPEMFKEFLADMQK